MNTVEMFVACIVLMVACVPLFYSWFKSIDVTRRDDD